MKHLLLMVSTFFILNSIILNCLRHCAGAPSNRLLGRQRHCH
ncbi:MAG: hypothetical protein WCP20_24565 [Desulfuromonadales bacterium]